ncbi:hypothetical protein L2E82_19522 [Cichorium intybus]|uniref:Uncharacterized protein n=1 Tax=Cichorium intybus TaxID=13427 RepID=A0ACB9FC20_CICIN|nr:hypothetical protein L2E82_19522 [Cichorium intybus]
MLSIFPNPQDPSKSLNLLEGYFNSFPLLDRSARCWPYKDVHSASGLPSSEQEPAIVDSGDAECRIQKPK